MRFNKVNFLVSTKSSPRFGTVELLANHKMITVLGVVQHIRSFYLNGVFRIDLLLMDRDF